MSRPLFIRILLSLLLLVSQQMATTHALSHYGSVAAGLQQAQQLPQQLPQQLQQPDSADDDDLSRAFAQDKSCHQCLAFAQLVGPLGLTPRSFAPPDQVANACANDVAPARSRSAVCPFQSRAPPQA